MLTFSQLTFASMASIDLTVSIFLPTMTDVNLLFHNLVHSLFYAEPKHALVFVSGRYPRLSTGRVVTNGGTSIEIFNPGMSISC